MVLVGVDLTQIRLLPQAITWMFKETFNECCTQSTTEKLGLLDFHNKRHHLGDYLSECVFVFGFRF